MGRGKGARTFPKIYRIAIFYPAAKDHTCSGNADKEHDEENPKEDPVDLLCYWSGEAAIMPTFTGAFARRSYGRAWKYRCE
jgi:hypothetical protein